MRLWLEGWFLPTKPSCQSCGSFIFCSIDRVTQCPKLKRPLLNRLWHRIRGK